MSFNIWRGTLGSFVSKRHSFYRSSRTAHWISVKNPKAPALRREAEKEWG